MEEERDLTGLTLIEAADYVVQLVEQERAIEEWLREEFYLQGGEVTN